MGFVNGGNQYICLIKAVGFISITDKVEMFFRVIDELLVKKDLSTGVRKQDRLGQSWADI